MQSCHSCTRHFVLTSSINLPSIIKKISTVTELCSGNENEVKNMDQGDIIRKRKYAELSSCTRHSVLTRSIILPSIVKIVLTLRSYARETIVDARRRRHSAF